MAYRTIDLSGTYTIHSVEADSMLLVEPSAINPAWLYADFVAGGTGYAQNIRLINAGSSESVDLGGTYEIASVTADQITLTDPEGVNSDWGLLGLFAGGQTNATSAFISRQADSWIGPFIVEGSETSLLVANFVALQGLYKDNGKKQTAFPITIQLEATPVDALDIPVGAAQLFEATVEGNASGREGRGQTLVCELSQPGRQSVRARRLTEADYEYEGTVVDEVKWKDLYGVSEIALADFGDVTIIHSRTYATQGALEVKDRKINALVTRMVEQGLSGGRVATTSAADIFIAAAQDPYIGGRRAEELDLDAIYDAVEEAVAYFGSSEAGQFCHTFDDDQTSFEETAAMIAQAAFCTALRQGSTIRLEFEKATEDSSLLFNHRNKLPGSETRTLRFGNLDDHDGVELEYRDPEDDAAATIFIPADRSAVNPRALKVPGVRSAAQAYWHAWRAWNKIRYQNVAVEFTGLQEAAVIARNERILIADNTRPDTMDGEVVAQDGLELELSQPADLDPYEGYTAFLQLPDGSVDSISATPGTDDRHVILGRAPAQSLALDPDLYARATYQIVRNDSPREQAFLLAEKEPEDGFTYQLRAINYSPLYYANDQLDLWLDFASDYIDATPHARDGIAAGGAAIVADSERGEVHEGTTGASVGFESFTPPASYTKAAWIKRADMASAGGSILGSAAESFDFSTTDLRAGHGSVHVSTAWPEAGAWHHAAVSYDAADGRFALYLDGELADEAEGIAQRSLVQLTAFGDLRGRAHDLRLIHRAIEPAEVSALYRAGRL